MKRIMLKAKSSKGLDGDVLELISFDDEGLVLSLELKDPFLEVLRWR